ncbi:MULTISPECIES: NADP oxidoreductase [Acetomicrobium]|uniref:NADP oxidoreductase n=1 Tax=Acetomicrobium hydrogeniformans TaxID=649746 RepID=A0A7V6ZEM4_9BACT|nr:MULTISPECIES: NADP oxidoreductase [Acetomicrobium]HHZ04517.1 NADP oxidoreductase [Acetomicrobium hydrogeniformans]
MAKAKVATYWLEACAGCHMSFLDIDERLVDLFKNVEILFSPIVDAKDIPDIDVGVLSGGLGNVEELEIARKMRERCKYLVAWGDCAVFGGINCMRNFIPKDRVLKEGYIDTASTVNPEGIIPSEDIPELLPRALPLDYEVKVDVYVPGCPPDADTIYYVFTELLAGRVPKVPSEMMRYD